MAQPDPRTARAVIVGVQDYTHLDPLPAVENNVRRMSALLRDQGLWGLPEEHCRVLLNPVSEREVLTAVHEAAAAAQDAFLLYFAGHGLPHRTDGLQLALPDTRRDLSFTALSYDRVRQVILDHCKARHKVVILDTCFSGRALTGVMGAAGVADFAEVDGTFLMTSSAENRTSMAPPGAEYTLFTGELVKVLDEGDPDAGDLLDMEAIYRSVHRALQAGGGPAPQQRARNAGARITFVRNRARGGGPAPASSRASTATRRLPPEQERLLHATVPEIVDRLVRLGKAGRDDEAESVLATVTSRWPAQQTAALLCELHDDRMEPEVRLACEAVAGGRSPEESAACLHVLVQLGADTVVGLLFEALSRAAQTTVASVARHLRDRGVPVVAPLVRPALAASGPGGAADLIAALGRQDLGEEYLSALGELVAANPDPEWVTTADVLLERKYTDPAYLLYAAMPAAVAASRSPRDVAGLLRTMNLNGAADLARGMLAVLLTGVPPEEHVGWALTLRAVGLDWADAETREMLAASPVTEVLRVMQELRRRGDADLPLLARWAGGVNGNGGAARSAAETVQLVVALRQYGMPLDAMQLLEEAAEDGPRRVAGLVVALRAEGRSEAVRLLERSGRGPVVERVATMVELLRLGDDSDAYAILSEVLDSPVEELLPVLPLLAGETDVETLHAHIAPSATGEHVEPVLRALWERELPEQAERLVSLLAGREQHLLEDALTRLTSGVRWSRGLPVEGLSGRPPALSGAAARYAIPDAPEMGWLSAALPRLAPPVGARVTVHASHNGYRSVLAEAVARGLERMPLGAVAELVAQVRALGVPDGVPPAHGPVVWLLGVVLARREDGPALLTRLCNDPDAAERTVADLRLCLSVTPKAATARIYRILVEADAPFTLTVLTGLAERGDLPAVLTMLRGAGLSRGEAMRLQRGSLREGPPDPGPVVTRVLDAGLARPFDAADVKRARSVLASAAKELDPVDLAGLLVALHVRRKDNDLARVIASALERAPLGDWLPDVLAGLGGARLDELAARTARDVIAWHDASEVEETAAILREDGMHEYAALLTEVNQRGKFSRWLSR